MVNNLPILIIGISLGSAFLLGFVGLINKTISKILFYLTLFFDAIASIFLLVIFLLGKITSPLNVIIGGFPPPFGINLYITSIEAGLASLITVIGFFTSLMFFKRRFEGNEVKLMILYLLVITGGMGMVFTGDLFNLFVFLEITSISLYGLIGSKMTPHSLESSFKYMVLGSLASSLMLLGIIILYRETGTLNMIDISGKIKFTPALITGSILLMASLIFELEIFPVNGWALDVYQSADPSISALIAGGISKIFLIVFLKVATYIKFPYLITLTLITGLSTFIISHLFAWRQRDFRRMLGYSSTGELGFLIIMAGLIGSGKIMGTNFLFLSLAFIISILNHSFAKLSLFSISGLMETHGRLDRKNSSGISILTAVPILSLLGMPPLPGFWVKLFFVLSLPRELLWLPIPVLLITVAEIVYYMRFYIDFLSNSIKKIKIDNIFQYITPYIFNILLCIIGIVAGYVFLKEINASIDFKIVLFLLMSLFIYLLKETRFLQWILSLIITAGAGYVFIIKSTDALSTLFILMFAGGALIILLTTYPGSRKFHPGVYPSITFTVIAMSVLVFTKSFILFFIFWELVSWGSFLLILFNSKRASFKYIVLASFGGFSMLYGIYLIWLGYSLVPYILVVLGILVKLGIIPFHIWIRDGYGESPDEFTPIFAGVISKMGLFAFIFISLYNLKVNLKVNYVVGFLGALTAFFATLYATFEDDIKKLLAYSSVAQIGYMVIGISLYSSLGMVSAVYHGINHLLFKSVLFISAMGIIYRTGKRNLTEMGGLIRRMPFTFIAVLMAIIALSGVPPLSGFGAKWLLYTALLEKRWIVILVITMAASILAFPYSFKILHTVFLGQLHKEDEGVKEVPWTMMIGEVILLGLLMLLSAKPSIFIEPIKNVVTGIYGKPDLYFEKNYLYVSKFGYWSGIFMMIFVGALFVLVLILLSLAIYRKLRKVKQLDVGYSGEVPDKPEDLHYAYGMFNHFRRSVGFLLNPIVEKLYLLIYRYTHGIVNIGRKIYTGDLNTYAIYFIILLVVFLSIITGVKIW